MVHCGLFYDIIQTIIWLDGNAYVSNYSRGHWVEIILGPDAVSGLFIVLLANFLELIIDSFFVGFYYYIYLC